MTWSVVRRRAHLPSTDENAAMAYKKEVVPDEETARQVLIDMISNERHNRPEFAPMYDDALSRARDGADKVMVRLDPGSEAAIVFERFDTGVGYAFAISEE